ncbi:serine/threonine protein kinase [Cadophora sp. M221]|nr:serine/threonine protein kinase [Cadophora sp. M221]
MATPVHAGSPQSNGISSTTFALQHIRDSSAFVGCSKITDYEMLGKLGEGTFGEVHKARSKRTGAIFALKKILMHNEKDGFPITALREIKLLKLLSHPNILKLEEMSVEQHHKPVDKRKRAIMYMVTPYMSHDLSGLLENPQVKLQESHIKCYMLQLLEGVRYLHNEKILHRDMKAANLLIDNKGTLQIADFGLARHYDEEVPVAGKGGGTAHRDYTTLVVTRWYRPPELLLHLRRYTTAIDLWGVGCVFGEMLVGKPILSGDSDPNQLRIIFDLMGSPTEENMPEFRTLPGSEGLSFPQHPSTLAQRFKPYGSGAISLLNELLKLDWKKRTNAIDALQHPYFRTHPLPAKPGDLPTFEDSHELDRRKFRSQKAAPPPAPKGGTVGMGNTGGWGVMEILITDIVIIMATGILLQVDIGMVWLLHHPRKSADRLGKDLEMIIGQIPDFHPDLHHRQIIDMMGHEMGVEMVAETVAGMASVATATDQHLETLIDRQEAEVGLPMLTPTYQVTDLIAVDLQGREMTDHVRIEDREKTGREGMTVRIVGMTESEMVVDSTTTSEAAADEHAAGVEVQSEIATEIEVPENANLWIEIENANESVTSIVDNFECQI